MRGVDWPAPRFTDNLDGTVTDNLTGLIWLKLANCFVGGRNWEQALAEANGLTAGFCGLTDGSVATDWRLPNIKELLSLVNYGEFDPALPPGGDLFTSVQLSFYWSSSSFVELPNNAWGVVMDSGAGLTDSKSSSNFVWPVRDEQ